MTKKLQDLSNKQGGIKCTSQRGSSIAKDLIDSEDPKHTLFCRDPAFGRVGGNVL